MTDETYIAEYQRQCLNPGPEGAAIIKELTAEHLRDMAGDSLLSDLPDSDKQQIARLLTEIGIAEAVADGRDDVENTLLDWWENRPGDERLKRLAMRTRFKQAFDDVKNREWPELAPDLAQRRREDLAQWSADLSNLDLSLIER